MTLSLSSGLMLKVVFFFYFWINLWYGFHNWQNVFNEYFVCRLFQCTLFFTISCRIGKLPEKSLQKGFFYWVNKPFRDGNKNHIYSLSSLVTFDHSSLSIILHIQLWFERIFENYMKFNRFTWNKSQCENFCSSTAFLQVFFCTKVWNFVEVDREETENISARRSIWI